ncbi:MAG: Por secretion system protein [Prevotella sp.]|nr:Por secretion system protein [Prevotella sp.]
MKRLATLLSLLALATMSVFSQVGTWKAFISYYEPQQIVKGGHKLYVRASNGLYNYNLSDQSITTYDKVRQLNDCRVSFIAWNPKVSRLIVVYDNGNIDLIDDADNVVNISALHTKTMMQSKTVNNIYIYEQYAYLATAFGVVKLNMERAEISESYILNEDINAIGIADGTIYIRNTKGTVLTGDLAKNLIDPHNWKEGSAPAAIFTQDLTDWNDNIELVRTLNPGGPKYNHFAHMVLKNNELYTVGGGYGVNVELTLPASVQMMKIGDYEWTILQDDIKGNFPGTEAGSWQFIDMLSVDVDPLDSKHVFAGGRTGLYEYYDGQLRTYWNKDNSILEAATSSNRYIIIGGLTFDNEGNLWMVQDGMINNSIIELTKDGEWKSIRHEELMNTDGKSHYGLTKPVFDSRGLLWIVNKHWQSPSFFCYDPSTDQLIQHTHDFVNQDGLRYDAYNPRFIAEDLEGNMWLNTLQGPFQIDNENIYNTDTYLTQIKVPRNDGTNYADYLLSGVDISCMVVDGGNRKWIGSSKNGVYLISADNMTQLAHFTTSNSPLLSDVVESIAINNETGEVFFGTENGLCSYMSDATTASIEMVKDNVYAYPNPVVSGYDGMITVVGLSMDADVKILSTSGQLVAQGRSNGGTFTWDGRDRQGRRVASGVYMVAAATSDGKKGVVCKVAVIK